MPDVDEMIEELMNISEDLSNWETDFLDSVFNRRAEGKTLTDKQEEILTRLYRDNCGD